MSEPTGNNRTEIADALAFGAAVSVAQRIDATPYVVVPKDFKVESLEHLQNQPARIRETVTLNDEASLIGYWHKFAGDNSMLFAQLPPACQFNAVFDYHEAHAGKNTQPRWCTHHARYTCNNSVPWATWTKRNSQWLLQAAFAEFIEDNLPDIFVPTDEGKAPSAADMLELARDLQAHKSVNFASSVRLSSGAHSLTYVEDIKGTSRKGTLEVPESFYLLLPPFINGESYKVRARFRYRIEDGQLKLRYDLHRPHEVIEDAFRAICTRIAEATKATISSGERA